VNDVQELLLGVWREACRHIEIAESVRTIAAMLQDELRIAQLLVRRVACDRNCIETVAAGFADGEGLCGANRTECTEEETAIVRAWCERGEMGRLLGHNPLPFPLGRVVSGDAQRDVLAGPLADRDGHWGVLVLVAGEGCKFDERHVALADVLREPLSIALSNDRQLRELDALREAAEAEKSLLLRRLGRKGLGDTIIGGDSGLREVMDRVALVTGSDAPVLVFGETGSGKEVIARAIHSHSARANGPFIRVNCGAIAPELIDSELFGHEQGAFTGAVKMRKGWFERADGGTLLLDEVAELTPAAQVRLLRILQDGWFERVGGHEASHVDVRIVAATNRDLAAMVAQGGFREDLWYRIAVFPIVLPPLRQRRPDIPALARHFAVRAATRFGLPTVPPTDRDIEMLSSYEWPGNVRELAAVMDRAAILGNGKTLEVGQALGIAGTLSVAKPASGPAREPATRVGDAILPLDEAIRQHIESALRETCGRVEGRHGAATMLGVNPNTLRGKMRKLGIDARAFRASGV